MLASLGRRAAVADIMGMPFSGFLAWCVWRAVYFVKLPGVVRRLRVAVDWNLELLFPRDITQIQTTKTNHLRLDHYEPGEIIISKHEIGREVFIIKRGEVEVFQPAENGNAETIVATLRAGRGLRREGAARRPAARRQRARQDGGRRADHVARRLRRDGRPVSAARRVFRASS